jgi:hypothetical protein
MEELTGLQFADATTNVTVAPPYTSDGAGLTAGGSVYPESAVAEYSDYLDFAGSRTTADNAAYVRQWQIVDESAASKRIAVSVSSSKSFKRGTAPFTTLITQKTQ